MTGKSSDELFRLVIGKEKLQLTINNCLLSIVEMTNLMEI